MRTVLAVALLSAFVASSEAQTNDEKAVCDFMSEATQRLETDVGQLLLKMERTLAEPMSDPNVVRTLREADLARLKAFPSLIAFRNALADLYFQLRVCAAK